LLNCYNIFYQCINFGTCGLFYLLFLWKAKQFTALDLIKTHRGTSYNRKWYFWNWNKLNRCRKFLAVRQYHWTHIKFSRDNPFNMFLLYTLCTINIQKNCIYFYFGSCKRFWPSVNRSELIKFRRTNPKFARNLKYFNFVVYYTVDDSSKLYFIFHENCCQT
jgi:hypothetical protein